MACREKVVKIREDFDYNRSEPGEKRQRLDRGHSLCIVGDREAAWHTGD